MPSVRVTAPAADIDAALAALRDLDGVSAVVHLRGADDSDPHVILGEVAPEQADDLVVALRDCGIGERGSIVLTADAAVISREAEEAERRAPGNPQDTIIWDEVVNDARRQASPSATFLVFLVLAALIAGVGRVTDQIVLIIGAMVVGPEFGPMASVCVGGVLRRWGIVAAALGTLAGGFLVAAAVSWAVWTAAIALGAASPEQALSGDQTAYIVAPDGWSLVIAALAGIAGVLSMTTTKSSAMVGVFISVTTIPSVAVIGLALAAGSSAQALEALIQLGLNVLGILGAGVLTVLAERMIGDQARHLLGRLHLRTPHRSALHRDRRAAGR